MLISVNVYMVNEDHRFHKHCRNQHETIKVFFLLNVLYQTCLLSSIVTSWWFALSACIFRPLSCFNRVNHGFDVLWLSFTIYRLTGVTEGGRGGEGSKTHKAFVTHFLTAMIYFFNPTCQDVASSIMHAKLMKCQE